MSKQRGKEERLQDAEARLDAAEKLCAETDGWDAVPDSAIQDFAYPPDVDEGGNE